MMLPNGPDTGSCRPSGAWVVVRRARGLSTGRSSGAGAAGRRAHLDRRCGWPIATGEQEYETLARRHNGMAAPQCRLATRESRRSRHR
jgi:hypothetical protein